ncbi:PTS glucose transporter subunit IIA [Ruminococcaceae bacterium OttesenSCG-928-A16]|nr:PTS glucose transporter subunit IIA [Ruminococcaceae bacterium OttesenSCG-928-A16]
MFKKLKNIFGGPKQQLVVLAPVAGTTIAITEVPDPTFSEEMLGKGVAIKPTGGRVVAPINGTVALMFDTGHAVSLLADDGIELLVHVGLDTIKLKGKHYTVHAKNGDRVKAGDLLMSFDTEGIAADGYNTVTPVLVCNPDDFEHFEMETGQTVQELQPIMRLVKKPL